MAPASRDGRVLERTHLTWLRAAAALLAVAGVVALAWALTHRGDGARPDRGVPGERVPYAVEVLNGTDVDGLARRVTLHLRRAGLDVVFYGTNADSVDSTTIIVRGTDPTAGNVVRDALGVGRIRVDADPRLLLDVTVVVGRDAVGVLDGDR
ncbi:MAG: LytR C-terminal domain-containing protein [Gemmatimonadota bacterium]|nr:LytR C-terminal domain-containing protein [Gemmatimonadota bacterium]